MSKAEEQAVLAKMRQDCLDNLYVFCKVVCGYDKFVPRLHHKMSTFLQHDPALRKLMLVPRDHFKSSLGIAYILWRICRNPEERILLAGDTLSTAQKKMNKIRAYFVQSKMLKVLFPEVIPPRALAGDLPGSLDEMVVPRKEAHAEPTVTAAGVTGARAGAHYTLIVCDDLATKEAKDQPSTMAKTIEWLDGAEALLEEPYENEIILIGTPWTHGDVHEHAQKAWSRGTFENFYNELIIPFFDDEGDPIFPELYGGVENAMDFAMRFSQTNPYLWSANFMLNPQVPDAEFQEDDLQYYHLSPDAQFLLCTRGVGQDPFIIPKSSLDVFIAIDPAFSKDATASKAAINVSGIAPDGNVFILDSIGVRGGTDVLIDTICEQCIIWAGQLRRLGVEKVGQQQAFIDYLQKELRRRGIYRKVDPLPPGSTKSKEARIRSILQPYFGQKRVWVRINQGGLLEEFRKFPLWNVRDELDAMAYAADHYWNKYGKGVAQDYDQYLDRYRAARATADPVTGY